MINRYTCSNNYSQFFNSTSHIYRVIFRQVVQHLYIVNATLWGDSQTISNEVQLRIIQLLYYFLCWQKTNEFPVKIVCILHWAYVITLAWLKAGHKHWLLMMPSVGKYSNRLRYGITGILWFWSGRRRRTPRLVFHVTATPMTVSDSYLTQPLMT